MPCRMPIQALIPTWNDLATESLCNNRKYVHFSYHQDFDFIWLYQNQTNDKNKAFQSS